MPPEQQPDEPSASAMPLAAAQRGDQLALVRVEGGTQFQHRMAEMGLTPGSRFTVVSAGRPGPFIISVKGSRLVIGRGMIHRVFVRPIE